MSNNATDFQPYHIPDAFQFNNQTQTIHSSPVRNSQITDAPPSYRNKLPETRTDASKATDANNDDILPTYSTLIRQNIEKDQQQSSNVRPNLPKDYEDA